MNLKKVTVKKTGKADVRCPICEKKQTESQTPGTKLNVKCVRCGWVFEWSHVKPRAKRKTKQSYHNRIQEQLNKK